MEELIPKIDRALLKKELTRDKFVKETNFGKNEVYIIDEQSAPNVLREIGRLREVSFRAAGGGTGKSLDLDRYDIGEHAFKQLLVWNPADEDIVGGYRFVHCKELPIDEQGQVQTPTSKLFRYSKKFIREYIPVTIELGRSFVQPEYQPARNMRKGIYSLDNLWDGLGAVATKNTDVEYFFGKITMYAHSDLLAREAIVYFLKKYFPDPRKLQVPHNPVGLKKPEEVFEKIFTGKSYEENFKLLQQYVRSHNENIPPLVNAYMNLSSTMRFFGTAVNHGFGEVEESGIILKIGDIYSEKKDRHIHGILK